MSPSMESLPSPASEDIPAQPQLLPGPQGGQGPPQGDVDGPVTKVARLDKVR